MPQRAFGVYTADISGRIGGVGSGERCRYFYNESQYSPDIRLSEKNHGAREEEFEKNILD